jgi:hypothetical protein
MRVPAKTIGQSRPNPAKGGKAGCSETANRVRLWPLAHRRTSSSPARIGKQPRPGVCSTSAILTPQPFGTSRGAFHGPKGIRFLESGWTVSGPCWHRRVAGRGSDSTALEIRP